MNNRELRRVGLKVTTPRLRILHILEQVQDRHLSAEEIYRILVAIGEDVGLATVYRVLTRFEEAGLIKKHHFEEGQAVFELNQGVHHDHMVCLKCRRVEEFVDDIIEKRQQTVASEAGFQMTDHSLTIYGICKPCAKEGSLG